MKITREDIVTAIQKVTSLDNPEGLRSDIKLTEQGLDSLDLFSVILALQETHGVNIPDDDVNGLDTIEALLTYLNARLI